MMALIEAARAPDYPAEVAIVVSNRPDAPGLERARGAGIEALVIDHKGFTTRADFDTAVDTALRAAGVDLVCQAGFMRIQSAAFATRWLGRQLNIHPSLLPSFKGLRPQQQALDAGVRIAGCTVTLSRPSSMPGRSSPRRRCRCFAETPPRAGRPDPDRRAQALSAGAAAGCGRRGSTGRRPGEPEGSVNQQDCLISPCPA